MEPLDRFMKKIKETNSCWIFEGSKTNGYGQFWVKNKKYLAHRWIYEQIVGKIPDGMQIDHLCRERSCVNPDHLEIVSNAEQQKRRSEAQTHCKHGHEFTEKNTYLYNNKRNCRSCNRRRGVMAYHLHSSD
jgi:hypothetical protein